MLRKLVRGAIVTLGVVLLAGLVLYQFFGLRFVLDGGGIPRPRFVESADAQAARVERHRAEQRAAFDSIATERAQPADAAGASPAPSPSDTSDTGGAPSAPSIESEALKASAPAAAAARSAYWTDVRGPSRDGVYRERPIATNWPAGGLTPLWKQPVGGGYASFVVAHGRAFTIEQRGPEEVVAAYDVATGRELWRNAWKAEFREAMGGDGPRATPTWSDGRVYALGATGELRALADATGDVLWRTNILDDNGAENLPWGMAASPLVVDEVVVVLPGGSNGKSVVAYHRVTGERVWSALSDQTAYSSPMLATLTGVRQLLVMGATRLVGLSVDGSRVLWEHPWVGFNGINASQPLVIGDNRVFVSSGYGVGAALLEVSGTSDAMRVREVWRNTRMKNRFASSVLHEGFIYGLDESILACIDAATGELKWKGGRYGYGQLLLADGRLIVLTEDGDLALVNATPARHEELARFPVLDGKTWNHPALAGGYLLVRNLAEMAAFDVRAR